MDGRFPLLLLSSSSFPSESRELSQTAESVSSARGRRVSLVLPAYNEEAGIRQAVLEACAALEELTSAYEVVVVDDGSGDGTAELVAELAVERRQVRLIRHDHNRGYGGALRSGFSAARCLHRCRLSISPRRPRPTVTAVRSLSAGGWLAAASAGFAASSFSLARLQRADERSLGDARPRLRLRLEGVSA
jgi:hypothetical protein